MTEDVSRAVSFVRLMNCPTSAGMTLRSACGSTIRNVTLSGDSPMRLGCLVWPFGDALEPTPDDLGDVGGGEQHERDERHG
jgi:hypothetical protein